MNEQNLIDRLGGGKISRKIKSIESLFLLSDSNGNALFLPPEKDNLFYLKVNDLLVYVVEHLTFVKAQYTPAFEYEKGIITNQMYSLKGNLYGR